MTNRKFRIVCPVENVTGYQWFIVEARSPQEAIRKFEKHGGELIDEELEVQRLGDPEVDGEIEDVATN